MIFKKGLSALKLPHYKGSAGKESVRIAIPEEVILPMTMHSGGPAVPVVSVGEKVKVGQLIAKEDGKNSSPVHATVSGTVSAIEEMLLTGGKKATVIRIKSDGKMEKAPEITPPPVNDLDSFLQAVRESGIVGLGGAAFPLWAKLDAARKNHIKTVLVNGAECEPFITSDHRTMLEHSELIKKGIDLLRTYLKSEEFIIGIENNKPDAIAKLTDVFAGDCDVKVLPLESVYPQGAKQVLLYNATGLVVNEGQRLASLGVIIINVSSLAKMAGYFEDGMPLVEKCVTVDGSAAAQSGNFLVPIGTPIRWLIEQAGGLKAEAGKVIYGGPMMGKTAASMDEPVLKATNAILVFDRKDCEPPAASACIHCGRCVEACPIHLNPTEFAKAVSLSDEDEKLEILQREKVGLCIECGSCSYICPVGRPLVDYNRDGKKFVRAMAKKAAEAAGIAREGAKKV